MFQEARDPRKELMQQGPDYCEERIPNLRKHLSQQNATGCDVDCNAAKRLRASKALWV